MRVIVRESHGEEAVWRRTFGNKEPLLVFALDGECLDAPDYVPAGDMRSTHRGPSIGLVAQRN